MPALLRALMVLVFAIFALLPALGSAQGAPVLALPLACVVGKSCVVQNYVDHGAGTGVRDYRCGLLSYRGHKGTDFRLLDSEAYARGVAVLAAAPGRVRAVRDDMRDASVRAMGKDAVAGREAGNSVIIGHGDGWETQYAHLRRGSIAVRPGDVVQAGQTLGEVGLSGNTEFPHLHFEVRHQSAIIDPFLGDGTTDACQAGLRSLWVQATMDALGYVATGIIAAGIAGAPPNLGEDGVARDTTGVFNAQSAAAVFWVQIYGAQESDLEELRLLTPNGQILIERRRHVPGNRAQWFSYAGKRRGADVWPAGVYRGNYTLYRGSQRDQVLTLTREITISPQPKSNEATAAAATQDTLPITNQSGH